LAKSLAAAGNKTEADQVDQDAKRYLGNYARWEVAPDKMPSLVRLKTDFNYAAFYRLGRQQQRSPEVPRGQAASMQRRWSGRASSLPRGRTPRRSTNCNRYSRLTRPSPKPTCCAAGSTSGAMRLRMRSTRS